MNMDGRWARRWLREKKVPTLDKEWEVVVVKEKVHNCYHYFLLSMILVSGHGERSNL